MKNKTTTSTHTFRYICIYLLLWWIPWVLFALLFGTGFLSLDGFAARYCAYYLLLSSGLWVAIGTYFFQKKEKRTKKLFEFIGKNFNLRAPIRYYGLMLLFVAIHYVFALGFGDCVLDIQPLALFYYIFLFLFTMGVDEIGLRGVLQNNFQKRLGFIGSTLLVAVFWIVSYLPLWVIPNNSRYMTNVLPFVLQTVSESFALACIYYVTSNVFLCMSYRTIVTALFNMAYMSDGFTYYEGLGIGSYIGYGVEISLSILLWFLIHRSRKLKWEEYYRQQKEHSFLTTEETQL